MNILIRNYPKDADNAQLVAIIGLLTADFNDELKRKGKLLFDNDKLKDKFIAELQLNGNLCIDYKIEDMKL